jgi:hypothetical protein
LTALSSQAGGLVLAAAEVTNAGAIATASAANVILCIFLRCQNMTIYKSIVGNIVKIFASGRYLKENSLLKTIAIEKLSLCLGWAACRKYIRRSCQKH